MKTFPKCVVHVTLQIENGLIALRASLSFNVAHESTEKSLCLVKFALVNRGTAARSVQQSQARANCI